MAISNPNILDTSLSRITIQPYQEEKCSAGKLAGQVFLTLVVAAALAAITLTLLGSAGIISFTALPLIGTTLAASTLAVVTTTLLACAALALSIAGIYALKSQKAEIVANKEITPPTSAQSHSPFAQEDHVSDKQEESQEWGEMAPMGPLNLHKKNQGLQKTRAELLSELESKTKAVTKLDAKIKNLTEEVRNLQLEKWALAQQLELAVDEGEISKLKKSLEKAQEELTASKTALTNKEKDIQDLNEKLEEIQKQLNQANAELLAANKTMKEQEELLKSKSAEQEMDTIKAHSVLGLKEEIKKKEETILELTSEIAKLKLALPTSSPITPEVITDDPLLLKNPRPEPPAALKSEIKEDLSSSTGSRSTTNRESVEPPKPKSNNSSSSSTTNLPTSGNKGKKK